MQQANSGLTRVVLAAVASLAIVGCSTHRSGPAPKQVPSANEIVQESKLSQMPAFADVPWADALKTEQDRLDILQCGNTEIGDGQRDGETPLRRQQPKYASVNADEIHQTF